MTCNVNCDSITINVSVISKKIGIFLLKPERLMTSTNLCIY